MNNGKAIWIIFVNIAVSLAVLVVVVFLLATQQGQKDPGPERLRRLAALYEANELPGPASFNYERYLEKASLSAEEEARIHYLLGNIYFEKLLNHEGALAHYLAADDLSPSASWKTEAQKRIIACLEKLGRSQDAQRMLEAKTSLLSKPTADSSPLVAKVGEHEIRLSELNDAISNMSPDIQARYQSPEGKRFILDQMIKERLLYDLAQRKGLTQDEGIKKQLEQYQRMYLANLAFQMEMESRIKISEEDLRKYYDENQEAIRDKEGRALSFEEVKDQLILRLKSERANEIGEQLMQELEKLSGVTVYEDALSTTP
jgi:hypothetical protein